MRLIDMTNLRKCPKCGKEPVLIFKYEAMLCCTLYMYQCCNVNNQWTATKSDCKDEWNYYRDIIDGGIERLQKELKDEREALHEVCYGITKNCELCKKYAFGREQTRCVTCPTRHFHEIAVGHMKRLDELK